MRIVLVGSPGMGRRKMANAIKRAANDLEIPIQTWDDELDENLATGRLADYRVELFLASQRALAARQEDTIFAHSIIDSVAHLTQKLSLSAESGDAPEETLLLLSLLQVANKLLVDSLEADLYILVPGNDGSFAGKELEEIVSAVMDVYELPHLVLQDPKEAAKIMKAQLKQEKDDEGAGSAQSDRED